MNKTISTAGKYLIKISIATITVIFTLSISYGLLEIYLNKSGYVKDKLSWDWIVNFSNGIRKKDNEFLPDPVLIFKPKPNIINTTNKYGFRIVPNQPESIDKSKPTIITLGDSFTYSDFVSNHDSFPNLLKKYYPESNVFNAGVMSYGTDQEIVFLKDFILDRYSLHPEMVVWTIYLNDLYDTIGHPLFVYFLNNLVRIPGWINGTYISRVIIDNLSEENLQKNSINFLLSKIQNINPASLLFPYSEIYVKNKMVAQIRYMAKLAEEYKFKLIIVLAPNQGVSQNTESFLSDYYFMKDILNSSGQKYLDTQYLIVQQTPNKDSDILGLSADNNRKTDKLFNPDSIEESPKGWKHLSPYGNKIFADLITNYIKE